MAKLKRYGPGRKRVRIPFWTAIRTMRGRERWAKINIEKAGALAFIPYVKEGLSPKLTPLFPGYVFVKIINGEWGYLRSTPGVLQVLIERGKPPRLQNLLMDEMLKAQEADGYIDLSPALYEAQPDEMVKVKNGLFKDHLARYIGLTSEQRVIAVIEFLGTSQELELRRSDIGPAPIE